MELKLEQGRYVPGTGGRPERVTGAAEIAQRVTMKLTAHRGGFQPLPAYGSRLDTLLYTARPSEYGTAAMQYIAEALSDEPEVTVTDVEVVPIPGALQITVRFTASGEAFETVI